MTTKKSIGKVTAYAAAVKGGYTGTYEDFVRQQAEYAQNAADMEQGLAEVRDRAQAAESARNTAVASANAAHVSEVNADTSARNAAASESAAIGAASHAVGIDQSATESANAAAQSARDAATSEANAKNSETAAKTSETNAKTSETNAKSSETAANEAKNAAKTSETNAADSAYMATQSERKAKTSETNAKNSETAAEASKTAAKTSETNAKSSETNAAASASAAAESEANAAGVLADAEMKRNKVTRITAESTDEQYPSARAVYDLVGPSSPKYGVLWDKVNSKCVRRLWNAVDITMDTTNFGHFGTVNPNYNNPFDDIYPWSERRVCNVDLVAYAAMDKNGYDVRKAVTAWEDEEGFSYDPAPGVMVGVYTPEFWGTSYDTPEGRVFAASPVEQVGWVHFEPTIGGRWHGTLETIEIGGTAKTVLGCRVGMPCTGTSMANIHTYAENADLTLDDPYSYDATTLLMVIEYATMESQGAVGSGCSNLYTQNDDTIQEAATNTNKIKVLSSKAANCIVNAIIDIGTTNGGRQIANRLITAVETDPNDSTLKIITISGEPITVTTAHYWSIHGCGNAADAEIGSKSGYIGVNVKCNAYYRGQVVHGNMFRYVLGAYREKNTNHIWIAHTRAEAELYNALNKAVHFDTGIVLPINAEKAIGGYIKKLDIVPGKLCVPPFCSEIGGTSANPVGDYSYIPKVDTVDTVEIVGGHANNGANGGRFYGNWNNAATSASWDISGVPFLKSPERGA